MASMPATLPPVCAVRLIRRGAGQTHRTKRDPLLLFTRTPETAVAELLSGRDSRLWEVRIEDITRNPNGERTRS